MGEHGAGDLVADGDLGAAAVAHDRHGGEGAGGLLTVDDEVLHPGLHGGGAAIDVAVVHAGAQAVGGEVLDPGVSDGLLGRKDGEVLDAMEERSLERREGGLELAFHDAGGDGLRNGVWRDDGYSGATLADRRSDLGRGLPDGRNDTKTCDCDRTLAHECPLDEINLVD